MATDVPGDRRTWPSARFLAIWLAPALVVRVGLALAPWDGRHAVLSRLGLALAGLPQDAFVAVEALLLAQLLRKAPRRLASAAVTSLFCAVQLYLLFDFLLYLHTGLRIDARLLYFSAMARELFDSARALGLYQLIAAGAAVVVAAWIVLFRRFQALPEVRPSHAAAALVACAVAGGALTRFPFEYFVRNAVGSEQLRSAIALFAREPDLSAAELAQVPPDLRPRGELYETVSPQFPLLKRTAGFEGEEHFALDLKPGERPNVVLYFMESFRALDVGVLGGKHGVSPVFDRLAGEGVLFRNVYTNGVQTTRAVLASLYGLLDRAGTHPVQSGAPDLPLVGLPQIFQREGYRTAYIHNGSLEFEKKRGFFPIQGYEEVHGREQVSAAAPPEERTSWGVHDEVLVPYVVSWLKEKDQTGQPSFLTVFTVSNHHPWIPPSKYPAPRIEIPGNPQYSDYLRTFHYSDYCLGLLVDSLRREGLAKKTVLVVLGDHGQPMGEHDGNFMEIQNLYEENIRIPLLLLADGRLRAPAVVDDVGSEVDLIPTLMDALGLTGLNHAIGSSLRRKSPDRPVFLVNPYGLAWIGMREGPWKYAWIVQTKRHTLFDLSRDPEERVDLADRQPERAARLYERAMSAAKFSHRLIESRRVAPPR